MNPFDDPQQQTFVLDRVEAYGNNEYEVSFDRGLCGSIVSPDIEPKVGDEFTYWGSYFGPRRGFAINSVVVQYMTQDEQRAQWDEENRQRDKEAQEAFAASLDDHNRRIHELPVEFQTRLHEFREASPDWGWNYEAYELFCCEEAVRLANHFKTTEALVAFSELDHKEQNEVFDAGDQHSGNTWGTAMMLAHTYLTSPDILHQVHGAMCPLVGCKGYGCYAARIKNEVEIQ